MKQLPPYTNILDEHLPATIGYGYRDIKWFEDFRRQEYPQLANITYLDHAGTTLYPISLIHEYSAELCADLFGNPHSKSPASQLTCRRIDDIRLKVLQLFNADPECFDLVFVANATAAIKLVGEAFRELENWEYCYSEDSHTSMIGLREWSSSSKCLSKFAMISHMNTPQRENATTLFAWPGQSNFTGERFPANWTKHLIGRETSYSLFDAAALVSTCSLNLSDPVNSPDFTAISFNKIFGFPDLGSLIVKRSAAHVFERRKYFGGGTVAALIASSQWSVPKNEIHSRLEDGTIPFHSVLALDHAINIQKRFYGSMENISAHTAALAKYLYLQLRELKHGNGRKVCSIYTGGNFEDSETQGPIICFNVSGKDGIWVGYTEFEKLAALKGIHIRSGGLCNPGGVEKWIDLKPWEIQRNYQAGHVCGDDHDIVEGKPMGALRVSLGAMSTTEDALSLIAFIREFYLDEKVLNEHDFLHTKKSAVINRISIYPIKSCHCFDIPRGTYWPIEPYGLRYDRQWFVIHKGTGRALNQKQYPRMTLIRPTITTDHLQIQWHETSEIIRVPINPAGQGLAITTRSTVCGETIEALLYTQPEIEQFFTKFLQVPSTLALYPPDSDMRQAKSHLRQLNRDYSIKQPISLSNESPFLLISQASVDALNAQIAETNGKKVLADVFRGNFVISGPDLHAYEEDFWTSVTISNHSFTVAGSCRRCHMVCLDQSTGEKDVDPFVTLSKHRKKNGRILFGQHLTLRTPPRDVMVTVGDKIYIDE
ncbi:Molybdenum cofactor sulfurase [Neolecta irregularis DAH-3]|uniref:Molybdenum cofactor sulfurase n=1 Tax=Neolecta irregularis (strain DAH-3) TaxID=1198029 RepID=A0A1U7LMA9_NEOID|nr:Molybdenum cofactor sulfurase [Neolecta irregularis DAH-3]|eukprot:OLL23779.1 Molybdenum cofactor sulfurase [Neolecta irregularis DAH-3]